MNPFDYSGPDFLVFYSILAVVSIVSLKLWLWLSQSSEEVNVKSIFNAPYKIAFLRNGLRGVAEVATFSLLDRKLLINQTKKIVIDETSNIDHVKSPIEKIILKFFKTPKQWHKLLANSSLIHACETYQDELESLGLLKNKPLRTKHKIAILFICLLLLVTAGIKIYLALQRHHHNVAFLIISALFFIILTVIAGNQKLTPAGKKALKEFKSLFGNLKLRAKAIKPGQQTDEASILVAVFGLACLSSTQYPFINQIIPISSGNDSHSCSSGSSCGGSSCGGGGCGGCSS